MSVVGQRLRDKAAREPDAAALVAWEGHRQVCWTWDELERQSGGLERRITAAVSRPDRTALVVPVSNSASGVLDLISALRGDLPVAVLARRAPEAEARSLHRALLSAGYDVVRVHDGAVQASRADGQQRAQLPAESVLLATGGSSGRPKVAVDPAMRTVDRRPRSVRPSTSMNWRPGQRQLVVGPLYHTAALTFFIEALCDNNTLIVQGAFDASAVVDLIADWQVEWLQLTPYHLRHLAVEARPRPSALSSVRGLLHLAAPCPEQLKRTWLELLGPERVFEMYGSSESIGTTLVRGDEWLERPGTVGRGFFTQIRILDQAGVRLPPGAAGEIYMRSGAPRREVYLRGGDRIPLTPDGFASVGDHGRLDQAGYLYLAPRQLGHIQVGGETVYPGEVESVLMEHPGVLDAAVLGVPDPRLGECLIALVIPAGGHDQRSMRKYLLDHVSRHKVPREIRFVASIPHTEVGKIDRGRLGESLRSTGHAPAS